MTFFFLKWKYTRDFIFFTVLFWNVISIGSWEDSPTGIDRITINMNRRNSPHRKIATIFLSWTLSICNNNKGYEWFYLSNLILVYFISFMAHRMMLHGHQETCLEYIIPSMSSHLKRKWLCTVWPQPIWIKVRSLWQISPQHQSTYLGGPESASIEIPPFRPKFT